MANVPLFLRGAIKHAIQTVSEAIPQDVGPHERIAQQHQRDFASKALALQADLEALTFPTDFEGLDRDIQALHSTLAAIQNVVKDNRYIYAFFKKDLAEFNSTMNELTDQYVAMHKEMEPVRSYSNRCAEVQRKQTDDSLSKQLERVTSELADTRARLESQKTQEKKQAMDLDEKKMAETDVALANAKKAEHDAANRFYSALDALEGPLKRHARGKNPGAYANAAERYLSVKEDFLKDCLLDSEELAPLLDALSSDLENPAIAEFIEKRNAWADEFEQARESRIELEHQRAVLRAPQDRMKSMTASIQELSRLDLTLGKKAAAISESIATAQREIELEAERLLATAIRTPSAPSE